MTERDSYFMQRAIDLAEKGIDSNSGGPFGAVVVKDGKIIAEGDPQELILKYAPEPPVAPLHGNLEDVFLTLTGHDLRE